MEKPTTIILLKKHNNKMTPNGILLYPQSRASLASHLTNVFLQWLEINTETYNWTMCSKRETLELTIQSGMSYQTLPFGAQGST